MPANAKPAEKRQRRNKPHEIDVQIHALNTEDAPPAPADLPEPLPQQWTELWASDLATVYTRADLPAMRRLFRLYAEEASFDEEGMKNPVSKGSKNQQQIHPLLKQAHSVRNEILSLEDRFGLNPAARLKLDISLGEAHRSLKDMNRRVSERAKAGGAEVERPDPRLSAIVTTAS